MPTRHLRRDSARDHYIRQIETLRPVFILAVLAVLVLGLGLNLAGRDLFLRPDPQAATHPATVLGFLCLCAGMAGPAQDRRRTLALFGAIAVCVIYKVAEVLVPGALSLFGMIRGRMGGDTALSIICLALVVLARGRRSRLAMVPVYLLAALVLADLIALSYGLPFFGQDMAPTTFLAACIASAAALSFHLHRPLIRAALTKSTTGTRTRLLLGVTVLVPWLNGLVLYRWVGVPERSVAVEAMMINGIIWSMALVTLYSGLRQDRLEVQHNKAVRALALRAVTDELTGLTNRQGVRPVLEDRFAATREGRRTTAIVLFDIDHFKRINDTFGHGEGDAVLRQIRPVLSPLLRSGDTLARWGGEEFLLVLDMANPAEIHSVTDRLLGRFRSIDLPPQEIDVGTYRPVTASLGVSLILPGDRSYEEAITRADEALYRAKAAGRDQAVLSPEIMRLAA